MLALEHGSLEFAQGEVPDGWTPQVALILGIAHDTLTAEMQMAGSLPYNLMWPWISGRNPSENPMRLMMGELFGLRTMLFCGEIRGYDGYEPARIVQPVLLAHAMGAKLLVVLNTAGSLASGLQKGHLMIHRDLINATGMTPLRGPHNPTLGPRRPGQKNLYPHHGPIDATVKSVVGYGPMNPSLGIYVGVNGPEFETHAQSKMLGAHEACAVGATGVHEVIAANACGLNVIGLSLITNQTGQRHDGEITEAEIQEASIKAGPRLVDLLGRMFSAYSAELTKAKTAA